MEIFLIPIFFGFVTGAVGKRKGSSFIIWFIIGFILPIIGLVAAIMFRSDRMDPRRECPNCHAIIGIAVQVCPRCGEDLDYPEELLPPKGYQFADEQ